MKRRTIIAFLILIVLTAGLAMLAGCNVSLNIDDAWQDYQEALTESMKYLDGKNYFVKYRYKEGDLTITQKLNVAYGNSYIDGWDDFIVADRGVVKESKISTDYSNTYFGYSLKSDVKPKKSTKEDYKLGYIIDKKFVEGISASDFLALKVGDTVDGKTITADEENYKYTLSYALGTLDGINRDSADIISAVKNGSVTTLKLVVKDSSLYYGKYNSEQNCLIVQLTVGRITKIYSSNANDGIYFINYAGPKISLQAYDKVGA